MAPSTLQRWKTQLKKQAHLPLKNEEKPGVKLNSKRLKITRKKTTLYRERNENIRYSFQKTLAKIPEDKRVYIDECGIDQCLTRDYARAPRGQKVVASISGRKFKRTNIVSGICQGKWVSPLQYDCSTDSVLFEYWFEHCLLKEVPAGSTLILDNATFHRKSVLPELARKYHCEVLFLPSYSPDLNPIEKKWAWFKQKLRSLLLDFQSFD